ncbi:CaiB/BaiF CoA transferase family protein [uncultured Amnibacterium sp.]|uniref:CaiB/BaiF CoA transferase family protein n=1 Tax=uncultured Amnibacterium sp. TaxID=1631851 RepID=UPI0035CAA6E1
MTGPLDGIIVIDLSRAMAGPYCTALLADMGAQIIKVESVNGGDSARQWPPFENEHSLYFESANRNKRSICIDFYSSEGREILDRLIADADVLVENFKLGTLEKMGLTPAHLDELNPRLVIGSVNAFGLTGPMKDDAGLDQVVQGMSGLISVTGSERGDTYRVGVPIVDITSGIVCAFGIVSALLGRSTGHPVGHVSTSLLETGLGLSVFQGQRALTLGETPRPQGNNHPTIAPYGKFVTATEPLTIAVGSEKQWRAFCDLLDLSALADDPRFDVGAKRSTNRTELKDLIETALLARTADQWVPLITAAGIPCGPIYDYTQAFATEQVTALELVQRATRQDGSAVSILRGPLSLDGVPSAVRSSAPALGQHTAEVLRELGYSDEAVRGFEAAGRVRTNTVPA